MESSRKVQVYKSIERILEKEIPNELKAHRIYEDVINGLLQEVKDEYEKLFFADCPSDPLGH